MPRAIHAVAALLLLAACFGPDPNLTDDGKGLPVLTVEFPEKSPAGSVQTATLTVDNPGPGDIGSVVVTFVTAGIAAVSGPIPAELVPITTTPDNPAIAGITPEPTDVSDDGIVYVFEGVEEGGSLEIAFDIRIPDEPGPAANSITVYAGEDTDRIRGVRVETEVTR
ncbi:MAG TPA: hypothetical protein VHN37_04285 [Actinomycetota bacterium]|nr:hypothetical protein [Actinomycetota bacterium]